MRFRISIQGLTLVSAIIATGASVADQHRRVFTANPATHAPVLSSIAGTQDVHAADVRLPIAAQGAIGRVLGRDRLDYHAHRSEHGFIASNERHAFEASFTPRGVQIRAGDGEFGLALRAIGYGETLRPVEDVAPTATKNTIEYSHGDVVEWYANGPLGLQQGFTLERRPAASAGALTLALKVSGNLKASIIGPDVIALSADATRASLYYRGLVAFDADGRELPARMELRERMLLLRVDDREARYPLTIDPFVQQAKLTASDGMSVDELGYSVAVSGDTVVAGAPIDDIGANTDQGSAYVFVRPASGWADATETAKLTASDGAPSDQFGISVAIAGETIVVGANVDDIDTNTNQGSAYVFVKPASGWVNATETAKLTASDGSSFDNFGMSVAVSGETVVVGAYNDFIGATGQHGSAYVFVKPASGWATATETAKLTASDGAQGDVLGTSVAVSGDTVVAGAPFDDVAANIDQGSAYVFVRPASGWTNATETARLNASDGAAGDQLGWSVAASGDTVVAGAHRDAIGGNAEQGSAYVFVAPAAGWTNATETAKLTASDGAAVDVFGYSVAAAGGTVVVGTPFADVGGNVDQGSAYTFTKPASGWASTTETAKLTASDGAAGDDLGVSVAVSGGTIVVGAPMDRVGLNFTQGSAYVFGTPGDPPATIILSPRAATNTAGATHAVTATVEDASGNRVEGITVHFAVTGANSASGSVMTGANGQASFTYTGTVAGDDTISAYADANANNVQDTGEPSATAGKTWVPGAPVSLSLSPIAEENPVGTNHTVTALAKDAFGNPTPNIVVRFSVTGSVTTAGSCTTDASGLCTFTYAGPSTEGADGILAYADTNNNGVQDGGEPPSSATKTWHAPAPRPILEYRFEEGIGATARNTGRFADADGTLSALAAFSADVPPGVESTASLFLNGDASSHVDVPDNFDYTADGARGSARLSQLTIEAWVKPLALDQQRFIWDDYGNPGVLLAISSGVGQFNLSTDQHPGLGISTFSGTPAANRWQHIAGVYDGRELRLFIDGQDTCAPAATSGAIIDQSSAPGRLGLPAFIGFTASDGHSFHGFIDELKIYAAALDRSQLAGGFFAARPMAPCGAPNRAPAAADDVATTDEDTPATIAVLSNDTDPEGNALTAVVVSGPANGVLAPNADGSVTYTPAANFHGQDNFTYKANDGQADSNVATVSITVGSINDPPVASAGGPYNVDEGGSVALNGSATDADGDSLTFVWDLDNDGSFETPGATATFNAAGLDGPSAPTVRLRVTDSAGAMSEVAAIVTVVNVAPALELGANRVIDEGSPLDFGSATFSDPGTPDTHQFQVSWGDGTSDTASSLGALMHVYADNGAYLVTLTATDDEGASASDQLLVTIANAAPTIEAGADRTADKRDVITLGPLSFADPGVLDSHMATIDWGDGSSSNGIVSESVGSGQGTVTATHAFAQAGTFEVVVTLMDDDGASARDSLTITVLNRAPVAAADTHPADEDAPLVVAAPGVLGNDSDPDGDALTAVLVSGPANGTLTLNANGSFTYTPNANFNGSDAFSYKASDGSVESAAVVVSLTIASSNDPPTAANDTAAVRQNSTANAIGVLANDSFAPDTGETLTVSTVGAASNGTAIVAAGGTGVLYTPNNGFNGIDSFTYTVSDGNGGTATAVVNVTVQPQLKSDLSIVKTASAQSVVERDRFTFTLVVTNGGPNAATGVVVTDRMLLAGARDPRIVAASSTQGTCQLLSVELLTCAIGALEVGASATITVNVVAPSTSGSTTYIRNMASVAGNEVDPGRGNNLSIATVRVTPRWANLHLTKEAPSSALVLEPFRHLITVANLGPLPAENVIVSDALPSSLTLLSFSSSTGTCAVTNTRVAGARTQLIECRLGRVDVGSRPTIALEVQANGLGRVTNSAGVSSSTPDNIRQNNTASATTFVDLPRTDLVLTQSGPADASIGVPFSYVVTVVNRGPATVSPTMSDLVSTGLSLDSFSTTRGTCSPAVSVSLFCSFGPMGAGETAVVTLHVTPNRSGRVTNYAAVVANAQEPNYRNNSSTIGTMVR